MKFSNYKNTGYKKLSIFLLCLIALLVIKCAFIDGLEYPEEMSAGETETITLQARFEPAEEKAGVRLVVGFMAPRTWDARQNTSISYETSLFGPDDPRRFGTMSPIPQGNTAPSSGGRTWPDGIRDIYGIGPNVISDVEWVVFQSDEIYNIQNNQDSEATITIETTTGNQNLLVNLGVFIGNSVDGLPADGNWAATHKASFTECIEVTGGVGNITDFCNPAINTVSPSRAVDNDIITFRYQGDVESNVLDNANEVHLCATGYTNTGRELTVCGQNEKTKMTKEYEYRNVWYRTLWPRQYFEVEENETIVRIEYSFTNADGSEELISQSTNEPFQYLFVCSE